MVFSGWVCRVVVGFWLVRTGNTTHYYWYAPIHEMRTIHHLTLCLDGVLVQGVVPWCVWLTGLPRVCYPTLLVCHPHAGHHIWLTPSITSLSLSLSLAVRVDGGAG